MNPPVDRGMGADAGKDVFIRVTGSTDAGFYVSGAKVVATGSALTHYSFVGHVGQVAVQDPAYSPVFITPTNAPGVKLICRTSNEYRAAVLGSPFDYPLSSRLDENDAILVLDDVFVPWENTFIYNDLEQANKYNIHSGYLERASCTAAPGSPSRWTSWSACCPAPSTSPEQASSTASCCGFGEVIAWRNTFWALLRRDGHERGAVEGRHHARRPAVRGRLPRDEPAGRAEGQERRSCRVVVTDGGYRDSAAVRETGLPCYQRDNAPRATPIALHPVALDEPVGCGGVAVYPGDVVLGDSDGVAVVPGELAAEVAAEAADAAAYEEFAALEIRRGRSLFGLFPATPESRQEYDTWVAAGRPGRE
ncbi:hypothetical protein SHIRM173S_11219 [Streptomyces hirsutus]